MLSIITATYKNDVEFEKTLQSLDELNIEFEVVVVDGGESPVVREICDNSRCDINLLQGPDGGIYDAFNKGAKAARGQYICYLNSGDSLNDDGNYYSFSVKFLNENLEYHYTHSNIIFSDESLGDYIMRPKFGSIGKGILILHPSLIVRKTVFDKIGYFDLDYKISADYDFIFRLTKIFRGKYFEQHCPVFMDGTGVSSSREFDAIVECGKSLKKNKATSIDFFYFRARLLKYFIRRGLDFLGLGKLKDQFRAIGKERKKSP